MIAALLVLALQQPAGLEVMLGVDRDRVAPGEMITLTVRVTSGFPEAIRVALPKLGGFDLESRSERSDVTATGRNTLIELRLRATAPGEWRLGPVEAFQGAGYARGDPIMVTIEGGTPPAVAAHISPRLARLLQRAPPPGVLGPAAVTVAISDPVVAVGQQVDVVTIAWFERGLRQELRRAPTVESPHFDGVWSYQEPVPGGIASTRQVGGKWYDLFVLHQVVFPLTPGTVKISPAKLQYSVPLAYQFFSQDERYTLVSDPQSFVVQALPLEGRSPGFLGAVGHALEIRQTVTPANGRQGEAFAAEVVLSGQGNVALWPPPDMRWPAGVRVYPETSEEHIATTAGLLGGSRTFKFLLVADSAGVLPLAPLQYSYFDPGAGKYLFAAAPGVTLSVAPRGTSAASRAEPPPIRLDQRAPIATRLRELLPDSLWFILAVTPLLVLLVPRFRRRRPVARSAAPVGTDTLSQAEQRLEQALRRLGAGEKWMSEDQLAALLHQSGIPQEQALEIARLRDRLRQARFGGATAQSTAPLMPDVDRVLATLWERDRPAGPRWQRRAGLIGMLLLSISVVRGESQTSPEQLYQAGAYRAAAEGFHRQALAAPSHDAAWLNLGAAAWRAGDDALALAAWTEAARWRPRDRSVSRALALVPPSDAAAATELWVAPLNPDELWLLGFVAWLTGAIGLLVGRRLRGRWVVLLAGGVLFVSAGVGLEGWYRRPIALTVGNETLRLSPHERAPGVGEVARLSTVRVLTTRGAWVRVGVPGGQQGWIQAGELVAIGPEAGH